MKHGLILDLDGTLVNSLEGIAASLNRALDAAGLPGHPPERVRKFIGNGARVLVQRAASSADPASIDLLESAFKADYDRTWPAGTFAYDGIPELLEKLQSDGCALAVLSNKPQPFTTDIVAKIFPTIRFAAVVGQRPGIPHKPDPCGALEIAASLGLAAENFTVIGDSTMDLETATNAGMRAIAVTWGYHDRDDLLAAGADLLVDDPLALLAMLVRDADSSDKETLDRMSGARFVEPI